MKTLLRASIATVAVALLGVTTYGETGFLDRSVTMSGQQFGYQVYVPREFTSTQTWPIIVFLHGGGSQGLTASFPSSRVGDLPFAVVGRSFQRLFCSGR
jgi:predicted peptidase